MACSSLRRVPHERTQNLAWTALLLVLAALLGRAALASLHAVNHRTPPAALAPADRPVVPVAATPAQRPRRAVLVVIDGLRLDASRGMPFLESLRQRGVDAVARSATPSLSRPNYATLATGAPPVRSGVRNNSFPWLVEIDTIFDRAKAAGLRTAGAGNLDWWQQNFGRGIDAWYSATGQPLAQAEAAVTRAIAGGAELVVIHLLDLDKVAHRLGARAAYRRAAAAVDAALRRSLSALDFDRDALIVTADHGHRDRGGHGGPEPEVVNVPLILAGRGLLRGARLGEVGSLATVGPTLALLLGVELPRDADADPLLGALDPGVLGASYLTARGEESRSRRAQYAARLAARAEASNGEIPGSSLGRGLAAVLAGALVLFVARAVRRGARAKPLVGVPLIAMGPIFTMRAWDMPCSLSGIVRVELLVAVLGAGVLLGVGAYLVVLRSTCASLAAFRLHLRAAALVSLGAAPLAWLVWGYAHPLALPSPALLFLPLPAAFVGGCAAALLAIASHFPPRRAR